MAHAQNEQCVTTQDITNIHIAVLPCLNLLSFPFSFLHLQLEFALLPLYLGRCRVIHKPYELAASHRPHTRSGQTKLGGVQDILQDAHLFRASRDECDAGCMVDHRVGERHAAGGRLGRVLDVRHPAVALRQKLMAREERGRVAIGADAEQNKVKDGKARRVLLGKFADQLLLVGICELFQVVLERYVDRVYVGWRDGHFGVERVLRELVVGIYVIERDNAFVGIKDVPAER
jgi:hypothetical protein